MIVEKSRMKKNFMTGVKTKILFYTNSLIMLTGSYIKEDYVREHKPDIFICFDKKHNFLFFLFFSKIT